MKTLLIAVVATAALFLSGSGLAADDAVVLEINSKANSANAKADGNNGRIGALESEVAGLATQHAGDIATVNAQIANIQLTPGPQGETGPQGIQGETGPQGIQGETGPQGIQGETGPQGIQGETGPQGIQGETGPQGIQGETGPQGIQGETGAAGTDGVGVPVDGNQANDLMYWNGANWIATQPVALLGTKHQPSLGISYIIALQGIYPSRNGNDPFIGEISMFGGNFAPRNWAFCDGQLLPISQHNALFSLLGTTYGGDGRTTFALPDLRGRAPVHAGTGPGLSQVRLGQALGSENH